MVPFQFTCLKNLHIGIKVGSHDPILVQLSFKSFFCMIENSGVHTIQFSHPIISYLTPKKHNNSCFKNLGLFHRYFTSARSSSGGHFVKIFCRIERGKIKNWRLFRSNRMKIEHVLFSSNTIKNVGNLSKIGVHTSNCFLKKWVEE